MRQRGTCRYLLGAWAQRDPAAALAWVEAHPALSQQTVNAFLRGWTHVSPDAALAWVEAMPLSSRSAALREALVVAMSERDPAAALQMMQSSGWLDSSPGALLHLLRNWGGSDPAAALAAAFLLVAELKLHVTAGHASSLIGAVLNGAYSLSPADAAALLAAMTPANAGALATMLTREVFARDPSLAHMLFTARPDATGQLIIRELMKQQPLLVLARLGQVEDAAFRREVLESFYSAGHADSSITPDTATLTAAQSLMAGMTDETRRRELQHWLILQSAASVPLWAKAEFSRLPLNEQVETGSGYFRRQAAVFPDVAIASYTSSQRDVQDFSLIGLADGLGVSAPEKALPFISASTDAGMKAEAAAHLYALWTEQDPAAAAASLAQLPAGIDFHAVLRALEKETALSIRENNPYGSHTFTAPAAELIRARLNPPSQP